jgi:hypothetical protein
VWGKGEADSLKLFHKLSFITFIFVELHEQRSLAKVYCIGIELPLGEKLLVKGGRGTK